MSTTFNLKKNISIPVLDDTGKVLFEKLFKKSLFKIGYSISQNARSSSMSLIPELVRVEDDKTVYKFDSIVINSEGRESGQLENQAEVDSYKAAKAQIQDELKATKTGVSAKRDARDAAKVELEEKQLALEDAEATNDDAKINAAKEDLASAKDGLETAIKALDEANGTRKQKKDELRKLTPVKPIKEMIDKYNDVSGVMLENGELTTAGITWFESLPLLNKKVEDFINT